MHRTVAHAVPGRLDILLFDIIYGYSTVIKQLQPNTATTEFFRLLVERCVFTIHRYFCDLSVSALVQVTLRHYNTSILLLNFNLG